MHTTSTSVLTHRMTPNGGTPSSHGAAKMSEGDGGPVFSDVLQNLRPDSHKTAEKTTQSEAEDSADIDALAEPSAEDDTANQRSVDTQNPKESHKHRPEDAAFASPELSEDQPKTQQDALVNRQAEHQTRSEIHSTKPAIKSQQSVAAALVNGVAHTVGMSHGTRSAVAADPYPSQPSAKDTQAITPVQIRDLPGSDRATGTTQTKPVEVARAPDAISARSGETALTDNSGTIPGNKVDTATGPAENAFRLTSNSLESRAVSAPSGIRSEGATVREQNMYTSQPTAADTKATASSGTAMPTSTTLTDVPRHAAAATAEAPIPPNGISGLGTAPRASSGTRTPPELNVTADPAARSETVRDRSHDRTWMPKTGEVISPATISQPRQTNLAQPLLTTPPTSATASKLSPAVDLASVIQPDSVEEFTWDLRPHATAPTSLQQAMTPLRPEMPPHLAQQVTQAMHRNPDSPLEIALNPAELGRVRMTLTTTEAGIVMQILADRPETLDLMRRNISDLTESFADLGYEDIAFAFGQNDTSSDTSADTHADSPEGLRLDYDAPEQPTPDPSQTPHLAISAEGIDLRL